MNRVDLHKPGEISYTELYSEFKKHLEGERRVGCIVGFVGIVRGESRGKEVLKLSYEAYREMALKELSRLVDYIGRMEGVVEVWIHHVVGLTYPGDETFYVLVAADHRKNAFKALESSVDMVKRRVPIWKKEFYEDGESWVSEE